tara:strand:- start:3 stop:347 length:345 start_codon:yes stop_codon:yes gene_type:complete
MLGLQEIIITKEDILEAVTLKILHTKTPAGYIGTTIKKSEKKDWIKLLDHKIELRGYILQSSHLPKNVLITIIDQSKYQSETDEERTKKHEQATQNLQRLTISDYLGKKLLGAN